METYQETDLQGSVEKITFHNQDNHFTIARLDAGQPVGIITVLGYLPEPRAGERLRLTGRWEKHPRYGQQFRFSSFEVIRPADLDSLLSFLSSGVLKGIGPKMARRLVEHFGPDTLPVLETSPAELQKVKGIGPKTADKIARAWNRRQKVRRLSELLCQSGVNPVHGAHIFALYGENWQDVLAQDPFRLAEDWPRKGFLIAEAVTCSLGINVDEKRRARACICHLVESCSDDGHTFICREDLIRACDKRFQLDYHSAMDVLEELEQEGVLATDSVNGIQAVYASGLYQAENELARRLLAKLALDRELSRPEQDWNQILGRRLAISLSQQQYQALEGALGLPLAIISGGPGTGKTTLISGITAALEQMGRKVLLAAPTGRAARRLSNASHRPAFTIHKLLGYNLATGGFERGPDDPLDCDAVIVDEASMIDLTLMHNLVRAVPLRAQLILVGDVFQLPAIGPGNVLADLMKSGLIQSFDLRTVFRQAAESTIISNAHKVRQGLMPDLPPFDPVCPGDFCFIPKQNPKELVRCVVNLCTDTSWLPDSNAAASTQVQVLVPMHRGTVGTVNLNQVLKAALNPGDHSRNSRLPFSPGDKVMQLANDYSKEVFNGDIGRVSTINTRDQTLTVSYGDRKVNYNPAEIDNLALAYAISVHKSQGSEYPVVILPLLTQHYVLLQRNLLYTAITRASKMAVIVGSAKAVQVAVNNNTSCNRLTGLAWRLQQA